MGRGHRHQISLSLGVLGLVLAIGFGASHPLGLGASPVWAQSPKTIAVQVYERVPNLPLENQYIRRETNRMAADSTLVSRLIQYHAFVKGRSTQFRLDWKITLADYLGLNERVLPETYPGYDFLKSNPINNDLTVVRQLNRAQRAALVQALVDAHTGRSAQGNSQQPSRSQSPPEGTPGTLKLPTDPRLRSLPTPGSADLLRMPKQTPNVSP